MRKWGDVGNEPMAWYGMHKMSDSPDSERQTKLSKMRISNPCKCSRTVAGMFGRPSRTGNGWQTE